MLLIFGRTCVVDVLFNYNKTHECKTIDRSFVFVKGPGGGSIVHTRLINAVKIAEDVCHVTLTRKLR